MIHNGLSGCKLEIIGDGILRKYSSSFDYNERLLKQVDKQILFSKLILKNVDTPKVLEILKKRGGKFPRAISDQKYNDFIKEVCRLAELNQLTKGSKIMETEPDSGVYRKQDGLYKKWELVTSHIGRRSMASNFYGKIPTSHLINITNHASESQFLAYVGKSNKDLAKETFKYFE